MAKRQIKFGELSTLVVLTELLPGQTVSQSSCYEESESLGNKQLHMCSQRMLFHIKKLMKCCEANCRCRFWCGRHHFWPRCHARSNDFWTRWHPFLSFFILASWMSYRHNTLARVQIFVVTLNAHALFTHLGMILFWQENAIKLNNIILTRHYLDIGSCFCYDAVLAN